MYKASSLITSKIKFINVELIPVKFYQLAEELIKDSDIDDTEFVALTEHIRGRFWTGDKALLKGLKKNGWDRLISTDELYRISFALKR